MDSEAKPIEINDETTVHLLGAASVSIGKRPFAVESRNGVIVLRFAFFVVHIL